MADGLNGKNGKQTDAHGGEFKPSPPPWERPTHKPYHDAASTEELRRQVETLSEQVEKLLGLAELEVRSGPPPKGDPPVIEEKEIRLSLLYGNRAAEAPLHQDTVVQGLLHLGSISLIYGKPKSGKSFLATNLALAVADDWEEQWMDQKIKQHGPVLYVACEGHGGFWKRLRADGQVPESFVLALGRPRLIENPDHKGYLWVPSTEDIDIAIGQVMVRYGRRPILVVIDTVFRSFAGGDVNKSADMNAYVGAAQKIADQGSAVLLVHHANKGNSMPSGSVALMGGADTLILVERDKEKNERTWQIEEAKDGAETGPRLFFLEVVDNIIDRFGDAQSSCRVVDHGLRPPDEPRPSGRKAKEKEPEVPKEPKEPKRSYNQDVVWRELLAMFATPDLPKERVVYNGQEPMPSVLREQLRDRLLAGGYIERSEKDGNITSEGRVWLHRQLQVLARRRDIILANDKIAIVVSNPIPPEARVTPSENVGYAEL